MELSEEFVKVIFILKIDDDGYPPVGAESINAKKLADGNLQLDNTPFFVENVALGDIILGKVTDNPRSYLFSKVLSPSKNYSISIIILDESYRDKIVRVLKEFDCYCEYGEFGNLKMLAVSILEHCDYETVRQYLENLEKKEVLSYAELAV